MNVIKLPCAIWYLYYCSWVTTWMGWSHMAQLP